MPAEAYYHYTYYLNGNRTTPIRARFGVASLISPTTITVTVNDGGPSNYGGDDTLGSVLADLRQAIGTWNQVPASQLKLAFGGLEQYPQTENAPGIDITFTDLPPGLLGLGTPNLPARPVTQNDVLGQFVPITRSTILLTTDTSQLPGPTYREMFFTTAVHELGHALGLQHTWTGAAMTPSIAGSNTTRSRPIDADDIAALSVLYGTPGWTSQYGTITGRVAFTTGAAVTMASVVALPVNGPAVSALTNPDGSFTINGLPTNSYFVYVHPLPPDAVPANGEGMLLPEDQNGVTTAQPNGAFQTNFSGGTLTPQNSVNVGAGNTVPVSFSVRPQSSVALYDVEAWSYIDPGSRNYTSTPGSIPLSIEPAFLNTTQGQALLAIDSNAVSMPSSLQSVTVLGGFASALPLANCGPSLNRPCFYNSGGWTFAYFNTPFTPGTGARHIVFNMGNDIFVLPDALTLVQNAPPMINSVTTNPDGSVTVSGNNFFPDPNTSTTIYFDGLALTGTYNSAAGSITVTPPPGNSGQTPVVAAYNSDGQNSTFLQFSGSPVSAAPTYSYPTSSTPTININTPILNTTSGPSGFSTMVDITGTNTNFLNVPPVVGFGTSDVTVSRIWALTPTHLVANVVVAPNAAIVSPEVSVVSGFQVANQPFGIQIQPANPSQPVIAAAVNNNSTQSTVYPGAVVSIYGLNLPASIGATQLTLTPLPAGLSQTIQPLFASSGQIDFLVPQTFPVGPATMTLGNGNGSVSLVLPVAVAPPVIVSIINQNNSFVDVTHSAGIGDILTIQANGLDPTVTLASGRLQVTVGGLAMPILGLNGSQIQIALNHQFGGVPEPVLVSVDGSSSLPYTILAR